MNLRSNNNRLTKHNIDVLCISAKNSQKKHAMRTNSKFKIFFWVSGLIALLWFIFRVIPKPSRAAYPCMRASMPLASAFVLHIISLSGTFFLLGRLKQLMSMQYVRYFVFPVLILLSGISMYYMGSNSFANIEHGSKTIFTDPLGPNNPIGEAKGTNPGKWYGLSTHWPPIQIACPLNMEMVTSCPLTAIRIHQAKSRDYIFLSAVSYGRAIE